MKHTRAILLTMLAATLIIVGCDKAPNGVIKESNMAHVIAEIAKANALIEQNPNMFPDDSSKLALKQSILGKYDADLAMYDSSLVWYAHNLKIYAEVSDKALALLEKEANVKHDSGNGSTNNTNVDPMMPGMQQQGQRRVFPTEGDSANLWKEPQQWMLTSAMACGGYITWDYSPDRESRKGDMYSLNFKMLSTSGNSTKVMLAIDYADGATTYVNRTASTTGWTSFTLQTDTTRTVKRIYGFIRCGVNAHNVTFVDSIYLLRTHLDRTRYNMIAVQRIAGPKAVLNNANNGQDDNQEINNTANETNRNDSFPGLPSQAKKVAGRPLSPNRPSVKTFQPKPGLNKSVIPSRERITNPNGAHVPPKPVDR